MRSRLVILLVAVASFAACGELFQPAAAVVNGEKITFEEVETALDRVRATPEFKRVTEQGDEGLFLREFERGYLAALIRRAVLTPEAERFGIEVTEEDVQQRIDEIKAQYPSEEGFNQALREQGLTLDLLREFVRDRVLEEKLRAEVTAEATVGEEEIMRYYEEHRDEFAISEVEHILVEDQGLAQQIADQLQAAPKSEVDALFAQLARQHSTDPQSAERGGSLGEAPAGTYVKPFENAMDRLAIGEISHPVKTEFGYHVIRVLDRRVQPLEEVRAQIEQQLAGPAQDELWQQWVTDAYRAADVKVNPRYGVFDLETQQIRDATADEIPGGAEDGSPAPSPSPLPS